MTWKCNAYADKPDARFNLASGQEIYDFLENLPNGEIILDGIPRFLATKKNKVLHVCKATDKSKIWGSEQESDTIKSITSELIPDSVECRTWTPDGGKCYDVIDNQQVYDSGVTFYASCTSKTQALRYLYYGLASRRSVHIKSGREILALNTSALTPVLYAGFVKETGRANPHNLLAYGIVELGLQCDIGLSLVLETGTFVQTHDLLVYLRGCKDVSEAALRDDG